MKLLLTAFCAAMFTTSLAFAEGDNCDKCPDKAIKDESTMVAPCDKCDKHKKDEKKEEGTLTAGKDCDKGKCDKDKDESTVLAA